MTESEIVNFPHLHGNRLIVYILQLIPVLSSVCFQKYKQFLKKQYIVCLQPLKVLRVYGNLVDQFERYIWIPNCVKRILFAQFWPPKNITAKNTKLEFTRLC